MYCLPPPPPTFPPISSSCNLKLVIFSQTSLAKMSTYCWMEMSSNKGQHVRGGVCLFSLMLRHSERGHSKLGVNEVKGRSL